MLETCVWVINMSRRAKNLYQKLKAASLFQDPAKTPKKVTQKTISRVSNSAVKQHLVASAAATEHNSLGRLIDQERNYMLTKFEAQINRFIRELALQCDALMHNTSGMDANGAYESLHKSIKDHISSTTRDQIIEQINAIANPTDDSVRDCRRQAANGCNPDALQEDPFKTATTDEILRLQKMRAAAKSLDTVFDENSKTKVRKTIDHAVKQFEATQNTPSIPVTIDPNPESAVEQVNGVKRQLAKIEAGKLYQEACLELDSAADADKITAVDKGSIKVIDTEASSQRTPHPITNLKAEVEKVALNDGWSVKLAENFDNANQQLHDAEIALQAAREECQQLSATRLADPNAIDKALLKTKLVDALAKYKIAKQAQQQAAEQIYRHGGLGDVRSMTSLSMAMRDTPADANNQALHRGLSADQASQFVSAMQQRGAYSDQKSAGYTIDNKASGFYKFCSWVATLSKGRPCGAYKELGDRMTNKERQEQFAEYRRANPEADRQLNELTKAGIPIRLDKTRKHWKLAIDQDALKQARAEFAAFAKEYPARWKAELQGKNEERANNGQPIDTRSYLSRADIEQAYLDETGRLAPPRKDKLTVPNGKNGERKMTRIEVLLEWHQNKFYEHCDKYCQNRKTTDSSMSAHRGESKDPHADAKTHVSIDTTTHKPRVVDTTTRTRKHVASMSPSPGVVHTGRAASATR